MKQFCYVSEATATKPQLLEDLRNILSEARNFNHQHHICGVLYFSEGQFFQCIEGEHEVMQQLIEKLRKDQRHQDFKFFEPKEINQPLFSDWSMKYVSRHSDIQQFFLAQGFQKFEPKSLNQSQVDQFLVLLQRLNHIEDIIQNEKSPN